MSKQNNGKRRKEESVQRSFRLPLSIDTLICNTKVEHNFASLTDALVFLLREKAIEMALKDVNYPSAEDRGACIG